MSTKYDDRDNERRQRNYGNRSGSDYDRDYESRQRNYGGSSSSDYDRDYENRQRNYGGRSGSDYDRSYGDQSQRFGRNEGERERDRYAGESRWRGQYGRDYQSGREGSGWQPREGSSWQDRDYSSELGRTYGSGRRMYGGYGADRGYYDDSSSDYSQRNNERSRSAGANYPMTSRYGQTYGERGRSDYDRDQYDSGEERGWLDRATDTVASWFGDEEAERRRRMDEQRRQYRGRGPKGYRRSDERIKEDINDRLSEGYLDASDIEVMVINAEVTLTGTVNSRADKRRAEDIAEDVNGVTNVENRIRVKRSDLDRYPESSGTSSTSSSMGTTGTTGTTGATGTTGTTGTTGSTGTTGTTGAARGRTAGT